MSIDLALPLARSVDARRAAPVAEAAGFDGTWVSNIRHDPFVASALAATATSRLAVGTAVAVAFEGGRFHLGLGTQVRGHVTRRFSMPWCRPVERMREYAERCARSGRHGRTDRSWTSPMISTSTP